MREIMKFAHYDRHSQIIYYDFRALVQNSYKWHTFSVSIELLEMDRASSSAATAT